MKEKLYHILANVLEIDKSVINDDFDETKCEKWDSLAQLMIIEEIETTFKVSIPIENAMELTSVKSILDFLETKSYGN